MKAHCRLFVRRPPSHFVLLKSRAYCGIPSEPSCPLSAATVCSFFAFAPPSSCCRRFLFVVVVIVFLVLHSFVCPFARCTEVSWGLLPFSLSCCSFSFAIGVAATSSSSLLFSTVLPPVHRLPSSVLFLLGLLGAREDTVYEGAEAPAKGGGIRIRVLPRGPMLSRSSLPGANR